MLARGDPRRALLVRPSGFLSIMDEFEVVVAEPK